MRNEERAAERAEKINGENESILELPEAKEQKFKFKSVFTGGAKNSMKKFGAKNAVVVLSLLLIAAAVYINWTIFGTPNNTAEPINGNAPVSQEEENYFAVSTLERKQARDAAIEVLQNVVEDEDTLQDAKAQALEDITVIAANIELEANIETLVKAKGFEECVTVINGEKATVTVKSDGLLPNELSQILEIVYLQANILPANVNIIEK